MYSKFCNIKNYFLNYEVKRGIVEKMNISCTENSS